MQANDSLSDRRGFLRLALSVSTMFLLAGCGSDGDPNTIADKVAASGSAAIDPIASNVPDPHSLNAALNLAYLGAQYYGYAAHGTGLSADLTNGIGRQGLALGARLASFSDRSIASHAAEMADDKRSHVIALRAHLGALAVAQPQLDLSSAQTSAFSVAAQRAGIVAPDGGFDPYIGDGEFLTGAFLIENVVAATYRTLLLKSGDAGDQALLLSQLADAIYHGGLIRSLLSDRISNDASIGKVLDDASAMLAALDGSDSGDQTLGGASGASSNLIDSDNRPIPFTRTNAQVLKTLYLSDRGIGGFLPAGANGIPV